MAEVAPDIGLVDDAHPPCLRQHATTIFNCIVELRL